MIRGTTEPSLAIPAAMRLFPRAVSFVVLCLLTTSCSQPNAEQKREPASPPAREEGVVRIQEASRQFIEVEEVSGARSDSTVTAPARVDFRDGAVSQVGAPLEGRIVTVHVLVGQRVNVGIRW